MFIFSIHLSHASSVTHVSCNASGVFLSFEILIMKYIRVNVWVGYRHNLFEWHTNTQWIDFVDYSLFTCSLIILPCYMSKFLKCTTHKSMDYKKHTLYCLRAVCIQIEFNRTTSEFIHFKTYSSMWVCVLYYKRNIYIWYTSSLNQCIAIYKANKSKWINVNRWMWKLGKSTQRLI